MSHGGHPSDERCRCWPQLRLRPPPPCIAPRHAKWRPRAVLPWAIIHCMRRKSYPAFCRTNLPSCLEIPTGSQADLLDAAGLSVSATLYQLPTIRPDATAHRPITEPIAEHRLRGAALPTLPPPWRVVCIPLPARLPPRFRFATTFP
jgi:hypothetical protein